MSNHPWFGNIIEVVKSAGKDRNMKEEVQNLSYSRRNKRPQKDRERILLVASVWIAEIVRHLYVVVCYINYLLPLGGSIIADILKNN